MKTTLHHILSVEQQEICWYKIMQVVQS
jgi:hypothetical protein